jgi:hypothetical protein
VLALAEQENKMFILEFFRRHPVWSAIIILIILYIFLPTTPQPIMPRQPIPADAPPSPEFLKERKEADLKIQQMEKAKKRGSSSLGRAYGAAGIIKTLTKMGYPTKWTILGDAYSGSPVLVLECSKFSEKSISSFIEGGLLSDLYVDCFDRVDFVSGTRTWTYEINQSHRRERPKGKSFHFASKLTQAEFDQVDKQFLKSHGF